MTSRGDEENLADHEQKLAHFIVGKITRELKMLRIDLKEDITKLWQKVNTFPHKRKAPDITEGSKNFVDEVIVDVDDNTDIASWEDEAGSSLLSLEISQDYSATNVAVEDNLLLPKSTNQSKEKFINNKWTSSCDKQITGTTTPHGERNSSSKAVEKSKICFAPKSFIYLPQPGLKKKISGTKTTKSNSESIDLASQNAFLGEVRFVCEVCGKLYQSKSRLTDHVKSHYLVDFHFECEVCGRSFKYRNSLQEHLVTHTREKPHKCDVCDRAFGDKSSFLRHMKSHKNERKYPCHVCPKRFNNRGNLNKHLITHTGERPYKCKGCGKAFNNRSSLHLLYVALPLDIFCKNIKLHSPGKCNI
ncbi:unnamed protein product [Clavelina lepadiformis]|uniref:C2H2-type domain-containing protein n=1 Tax=Clavelina lepadiformis TaxID=159417 RepID=A0ABP0GL15_CLALP